MSIESAFYATNVFHYRHVLQAMQALAQQVTLASRFEVTDKTVRRASRVGTPSKVVKLLERRVVEPPVGVRRVGIGASQFLLPLMPRIDTLNRLDVLRFSLDNQSKAVARRVEGEQLFQFMEGLGHRTLDKGYSGFAVCERRHFHHTVLEGDPGAVGDFPFRLRPDPIGDYLDEEYERANLICVYSEVARRSFLTRGFDPNKVVVTPLGFPVLDFSTDDVPRRPHVIAYVGRCDAFKGIDIAVATLAQLGGPYELHVAGPASEEVRTWLGKQAGVVYRGILGRRDLVNLYRTAGVVLCPSIESFGYAALEGAGYGATLVCSDQTGAREFLPPETHDVVVGRDPSAWADVISRVPNDTGDRLRSIRAALRDLSWENSAKHTEKTLRLLISA